MATKFKFFEFRVKDDGASKFGGAPWFWRLTGRSGIRFPELSTWLPGDPYLSFEATPEGLRVVEDILRSEGIEFVNITESDPEDRAAEPVAESLHHHDDIPDDESLEDVLR